MRSFVVLLAALSPSACGEDGDATPEPVPGAPAATRALAFLANGDPVAIGGPSAFGLARLGRAHDGAWTNAADVPPFGARAQLFGGGAHDLYALGDATLYRLDDPAAFTWSSRVVPPATPAVSLFGIDDTGVVYAYELASDGSGAVVTWAPDEQLWRPVAGSRPIGVDARAFVVEPDGRVTWSDPARGIVRIEGGAQIVLADCTSDELGACMAPLTSLAYGKDGELRFVLCPRTFRLHGDAPDAIALPDGTMECGAMSTAPDGASLLPADDALLRLGATGTSWGRVAAAEPGSTYVLRDNGTAFAFGDGVDARGVFRLGF